MSRDPKHTQNEGRRSAGALMVAAALVLTLGSGCASTAPTVVEDSLEGGNNAVARRNLGIDHYLNGRVALAIRELKHAVTLNPDDAKTHMWLGEAYRRRGKLELAEAEMRRSLELDPDDHEALLRFSVMMIQLERYADSIEYTDRLIEDPTFESPWRALTNRGWAHLKLGHYEVARESFEEALDYQVSYWPARLNLGILANIQHDYSQAIEHLSVVVDVDPGPGPTSEAHYRLGEVFVSLGMRERAIGHLEAAIEQSPRGRWGKNSRAYLRKLGVAVAATGS